MGKEFDEAREATENMFNDGQQELDLSEEQQQEQETPEEPTEQEQPAENMDMATEAAQTAEMAAEVASEKDTQLQQVLQELETMKQQNQSLQDTISQMSQQQEETIVENAMKMPTLDVNGLAFADEETIANAQAEYAKQMAEFVKGDVMREMSPFVEQAKQGLYEREKSDVLSALSQVPELNGIQEMVPQLDAIIKNNKALSAEDIPIDEKYITAFAIAKGVNSMNTPVQEEKEATADELMALYEKNPEFQELIQKRMIDSVNQNQQVPIFSASSGAVNAALNIKEKPKTFEEASQRTREMFQ